MSPRLQTDITACSVPGCERPRRAQRTMCSSHANRTSRYGDPLGGVRYIEPGLTSNERFWAKITKTDTCWLWNGKKHPKGYGYAWVYDQGVKKHVQAHRWAWILTRGPISEGLVLDHLCRVRACVNPEHLEPVTQAENVRRTHRRES